MYGYVNPLWYMLLAIVALILLELIGIWLYSNGVSRRITPSTIFKVGLCLFGLHKFEQQAHTLHLECTRCGKVKLYQHKEQ